MNNNQGSQKREKEKNKVVPTLRLSRTQDCADMYLFRRPAIYRKQTSKKDFPNPTVHVYCSCNKQHSSLVHKARVSE